MDGTVNHRAPHFTAERGARAVQCYWCWAYNKRDRPAVGFASFLMSAESVKSTKEKEPQSTKLPCCQGCLDHSYAAIGEDRPPYWSYFNFWKVKESMELNKAEIEVSREALVSMAKALTKNLASSLDDPDFVCGAAEHTHVQTIAICHAAILQDLRDERREAIEANILSTLNLIRTQAKERERSTL